MEDKKTYSIIGTAMEAGKIEDLKIGSFEDKRIRDLIPIY